jgi:succinyl-diaminopimelate desuccinylase
VESAKSILGVTDEPQIMGGGTHARKFKNAIPFGPGILPKILSQMRTSELSGAHGKNEAVEIQMLLDQIKVYALTLIRLDQAIWIRKHCMPRRIADDKLMGNPAQHCGREFPASRML